MKFQNVVPVKNDFIPTMIVGKIPDLDEAKKIASLSFSRKKLSKDAALKQLSGNIPFVIIGFVMLLFSLKWFTKTDRTVVDIIVGTLMVLSFVAALVALLIKYLALKRSTGTADSINEAVRGYWITGVFYAMSKEISPEIENNVVNCTIPCELISRMLPDGYDFDLAAFTAFCNDLFARLNTVIAPNMALRFTKGEFKRVYCNCDIRRSQEVKPGIYQVDGELSTGYLVRTPRAIFTRVRTMIVPLTKIVFTQYYIKAGNHYVPYDPSPAIYTQDSVK